MSIYPDISTTTVSGPFSYWWQVFVATPSEFKTGMSWGWATPIFLIAAFVFRIYHEWDKSKSWSQNLKEEWRNGLKSVAYAAAFTIVLCMGKISYLAWKSEIDTVQELTPKSAASKPKEISLCQKVEDIANQMTTLLNHRNKGMPPEFRDGLNNHQCTVYENETVSQLHHKFSKTAMNLIDQLKDQGADFHGFDSICNENTLAILGCANLLKKQASDTLSRCDLKYNLH